MIKRIIFTKLIRGNNLKNYIFVSCVTFEIKKKRDLDFSYF